VERKLEVAGLFFSASKAIQRRRFFAFSFRVARSENLKRPSLAFRCFKKAKFSKLKNGKIKAESF